MFPSNHGYGQSLSEEEDLSCDSSEKCAISLSSALEDQGHSMQVLSQLEMLQKDAAYVLDDGNHTTIPSEKQRKALCVEDEIEFPDFNNEGEPICHVEATSVLDLDEKNINDQGLACISNSESDGEIMLNDEPSAAADSRSKAKPKVLFHFQSQRGDFPLVSKDKNKIDMSPIDLPQTEADSGENLAMQKLMAKSLEILEGEEPPQNHPVPLELATHRDCYDNSVSEFLDSLQEKSGWLRGSCEMVAVSRSSSPIDDRNIQEDSILYCGLSTDDEGDILNPKPVLQQKTMVDQLYEGLGAVSPKNVISEIKFHKKSGVGLFEKLQHVMQNEKERERDFLECSNNAISRDGRSCFDVRILSRSLEAKFTVCCCSLIQDEEGSQLVNIFRVRKQIGERTLTIIFSSRICGYIELEVGNLVRIQPPWKEVNIEENNEVIILSTYFIQLAS